MRINAQDVQPTAQNFHQWGAITLFNGLPSDNVRAIAQTSDGVLWFGTDNGLARFDGRRVQTFTPKNADSNKILTLKIADDDSLWIGTQNGAIIYKNGDFQTIEATKNFAITAILFDENTFLATENGVILKLIKKSANGENDFETEKIPSEKLAGSDGQPLKITSLANANGKIIAGTRSRGVLGVENGETFEIFSRPRPFFVNALAQDKEKNLWLGADSKDEGNSFFAFQDIDNLQRTGTEAGNVLAIEPDENGGAWLGTQANGLLHFRARQQIENFTFENTSGGLRSNTIFDVFVDREGVIWLGTNRGVCRFDALSPFNQTLSDNPNINFVRTFFRASDGRIYAGTNRGLFIYADGTWLETSNFASKTVYSIGEDYAGQLLICTPNGLLDYTGKLKIAGDVRAVANFQGRTYAAIFGRGIVQIENQTQIFTNDSPSALFAEGDKNLWFGTVRDGVFKFDGRNAKPENALEILRGAPIRKIIKGVEKDLWFAGERGLFRYRNGELQAIISNEDVRDVTIINSDIWATTLKSGLIHARFDVDFGWLISDLNAEQGLPSDQIFAVVRLENRLLIGTNRGLVNYAPSAVAPQIVATRVLSQRLYEAAELNDKINLDFPQNSILVEVAGLSSRTFPEQFQYTFTLKNADGEVLENKISNDAQFAPVNLLSGEYQIESRAFNKDLLASAPLIIRFSVARAPFPWTATLLGVLLFVASIGLIWAGIERRRISQKNKELAVARFDLANEAERERSRIARDLHDQTLADLRKLMMMSDELPSDTKDFRAEIESVSMEIRRICEDLSPSVLENVGLNPALEFLLQNTIENYKFTAAEDSEEQKNLKSNVQMQIYRIAQEVLNNIKRHSDAKFVEMKIEISESAQFMLSIHDDGTQFNPTENAPKGRGIANIKSRAAIIEAEIAWQNGENGGNVFRLTK
ncbi:MAG: hypothetical protein H7Z37_06115 [Pyrinomonadaceae bacterium]|nr:hypothetical protein [Pyrinomonadaceae bacterium]